MTQSVWLQLYSYMLFQGFSSLHFRQLYPINSYSIDEPKANRQVVSDFLQSFSVALNSMSATYRVSQLVSLENEITTRIANDEENAGSWKERFGFELVKATINSIELSDDSKEIIRQYAANGTAAGHDPQAGIMIPTLMARHRVKRPAISMEGGTKHISYGAARPAAVCPLPLKTP